MIEKIFVNLPVKNLDRSVSFFSQVGFTFDPKFTDKKAACMVVGKNIFAMLLVNDFFKTFTKKEVADAAKSTEAIVALEVGSKEKVDEIVNKALAAGGKPANDKNDLGGMYGWSFQDVDGHIWEIFHMDESKGKSA